MLFTEPTTRARVRGTLERQGYRIAQPDRLLEWVTGRRPHVLVVTGDDPPAQRARAAVMRAAPEAACVVLATDPTPGRYRELMETCTAVLPESAPQEDVAVAVAGAWRELSCLPRSAARALSGDGSTAPSPAVTVAPREAGWLRALADGATVAGLARTAGYSPREMYRLLSALYAQLGAAGRTEALLRADRLGLLSVTAPGPDASVPRPHPASSSRSVTS
ncbi:hypothetical protein CAE01nite_19420 [Cellulomonas aerilata]|uniref:HTH luxR-type domain-containing protein n=1 Tax=Cellulomonas aerilata TaxID=515326 RepID=A0A512DCQ6_9CELL|nr:hypothetical protein CAE01nite_19420 [Cellulomonas aerilata]